MEYYVIVSNQCNMQCKYCIASNITYDESGTKSSKVDSKGICDYIIREAEKKPDDITSVVFYGGEPLLNQAAVIEIIKNTKQINPKYALYTNGLLLNKMHEYIRQNIDHVFVSLDGIREVHNFYRKDNTFDKIVKNVRTFKSKFKGVTVARITFVPKSDIYNAVTNCLEICDAVFWQQVSNSNSFYEEDQKQYQKGLDRLVSEWFEAMNGGIVRNVIPFQSILGSYLAGEKKYSLRCGYGSILRVVSNDGSLYSCDEMIRLKQGKIGSIYNGSNPVALNTQNIERCKECEVNEICGGRCLFSHMFYSKEQNDYYCANTKYLIHRLIEKEDYVLNLIEKGIIGLEDLQTFESMNCTEQIP
jgi:putative peptide-modifying radical SAM enzyme